MEKEIEKDVLIKDEVEAGGELSLINIDALSLAVTMRFFNRTFYNKFYRKIL